MPALSSPPGPLAPPRSFIRPRNRRRPRFVTPRRACRRDLRRSLPALEAREPALRIEGDQRFPPLRRLEKKVQHGQLDFICGVGESPARRDHFIVLTPPSSRCATTWRCAVTIPSRYAAGRMSGPSARGHHPHQPWQRCYRPAPGHRRPHHRQRRISNQANYEKLLMKRGRFVYYRSPGFESDLREQGWPTRSASSPP